MTTWIVQVSAGTGPEPVRAFVRRLGEQLIFECQQLGLDIRSVSFHGSENAPRSVEISVDGDVPALMSPLLGTHVLLARSRSRGRRSRKRWFAGVSVHPVVDVASAVSLDLDELDISACRAGGPGGQHVNKTASAVRVVHRPSGIAVRASGERSQAMNRKQAIARIASILSQRAAERGAKSDRARRLSHYHFERGSAVCVWHESSTGNELVLDKERES